MQYENPSATTPKRGWRRAKLVAGTLALTMGAFGTVAAVTALPAFADVTSNNYTIGTPSGAVNSVSVTPTSTTATISTAYTVLFTATSAISASASSTVTVASSVALTNVPVASSVSLVDLTSSTCFVSGFGGTGGGAASSATSTTITYALAGTTCTIAAGDRIQASFTAPAPASASTSYTFSVTTTGNATSAASNTVTNSSVPPTLSASNSTSGANAIYTISNFAASGANGCGTATGGTCLTSTAIALVLTAPITGTASTTPPTNPTNAISWAPGAASYTVTYVVSGVSTSDVVTGVVLDSSGVTQTCTPSAVVTGCNQATLTLTSAIPTNATGVNITAAGTNPSANNAAEATIEPFFTCPSGAAACSGGTAAGAIETTNSISIGSSVTAITVTPSPLVASATATYVVTFKATSAVPSTGSISMSETTGPTNFSTVPTSGGVLVTDTTAGWHFVAAPGSLTFTPSNAHITIPLNGVNAIAAGDALTVTVAGVTNPGAQTISDFSVSTSVDLVAASAPAYTIGASGSAGVIVTPNPNTVSTVSTYTVSNLFANAAITGGSGTLTITANTTSTVLPNSAGFYSVTDITHGTGSGTVGTIVTGSYTGHSVAIVFPNSISSGDQLVLTIGDIINPSGSSSTNTMLFQGAVSGPNAVAPFPQANSTFPNGALINFSGTIYVFAGGHPFGIPTPTVLNKIRSVDHAVVLTSLPGTVLPVTTSSRTGTLLTTYTVNGDPTIYVVGTDGQLHGFSRPKQLISGGYDTRVNVTVNTHGGMTIGSTVGVEGAAVTAYATSADGAIVDSSGTVYTFAGGRAFGIPTPTRLNQLRNTNSAVQLTGTITSTQTSAAIASGVLLSGVFTSPATVYTTFVGNAFPFKTENQLMKDGYGGTAAVPIPNIGGLSIVANYTGS